MDRAIPSSTNDLVMQLSILIPARNEMFLAKTIENILENIEADTEVVALLDGQWADPEIPQHERVNVIYVPDSIGQRAGTNMAARLAKGKYVMKIDAHCSFDKGFDRKMVEFMEEHGDITAAPIMRNLWAFDWKCHHCGWKKYQGPTPEKCEACGKGDKLKRKMMWVGKHNPQSWSYCFDSEPHFQYFEDYKHRPGIRDRAKSEGWSETMSLQGSCWMLSRKRYLEYMPIRDELGSWGNEGIEMACREWLSGGRVLVNHNTWYAHMFRTQGGDFGFPYHQGGKHVSRTKNRVWEMIKNGKIPGQKLPVSWLIEKFWSIPGWTEEQLKKLKEEEIKP